MRKERNRLFFLTTICLYGGILKGEFLETISFRLLRVLNGSEKVMQDFSNRQSWHFLTFLLYESASPTIDQTNEKGAFLFLRS